MTSSRERHRDRTVKKRTNQATRILCYTVFVQKNVTITLDEEVARWARVAAAQRDISLSRFLAGLLREAMEGEGAYEAARQRFLAFPAAPLREPGQPLPTRESLHDRADLR